MIIKTFFKLNKTYLHSDIYIQTLNAIHSITALNVVFNLSVYWHWTAINQKHTRTANIVHRQLHSVQQLTVVLLAYSILEHNFMF